MSCRCQRRVHVQVDLVNQHNRRLRERIGAVRIALEHPAGK